MDIIDAILLVLIGIVSLGYIYWRHTSSRAAVAKSATAVKTGPTGKKTAALPPKKKSILEKVLHSDNINQAVLFYGSQTGTAEDLATRFAKELADTYGVGTLVCDPEDYDMQELKTKWPSAQDLELEEKKLVVMFFMATYGEGEPTDNAVEFYDWIMNGRGKVADEGDEEDEMTEEKVFTNVVFSAFGLGNKTYEHYNAMVRRLTKRLVKCGATLVGEAGEGDDDGSLEEDFIKWKSKQLSVMATYFGAKAINNNDKPHVPLFDVYEMDGTAAVEAQSKTFYGEYTSGKPRRWRKLNSSISEEYEMITPKGEEIYVEIADKEVPADMKHPYYSRIAVSKPLYTETYDSFSFDSNHVLPTLYDTKDKAGIVENGKIRVTRQCYHIELDLDETSLAYTTGDHVGIWPTNDDAEVEKLARALGISEKLNKVIKLRPNSKNHGAAQSKPPFPLPCSVKNALTHYLDLRSPMKQHHLKILAKYAEKKEERTVLMKLSDDRDLFVEAVEKPQKTLAQTLEEFKSVKAPLAVILTEVLSKTSLRYYSISSSSTKQPKRVGITAVVVRYPLATPSCEHVLDGKASPCKQAVVMKSGLATGFLERLHEQRMGVVDIPSDTTETSHLLPRFYVPMYIRTSAFKLPSKHTTPIVMVGPGTGLAPFRGFLWERFHAAENGEMVGPTWLFYGCRHRDNDWLYREEMEQMLSKLSSLSTPFDLKILTAFSRMQGEPKVYVQHRLVEYKTKVWEFIGEKNGIFYVCGDAKNMAREVQSALGDISVELGGYSQEDAKAWVKELKTQGRYLEDVWS